MRTIKSSIPVLKNTPTHVFQVCTKIRDRRIADPLADCSDLEAEALAAWHHIGESWPRLDEAVLATGSPALLPILVPDYFSYFKPTGGDWSEILLGSSPEMLMAASALGMSYSNILLPVLERAVEDDRWVALLEDKDFQVKSCARLPNLIHAFGSSGHPEAPFFAHMIKSIVAENTDLAEQLLQRTLSAGHIPLAKAFIVAGAPIPNELRQWFLPLEARTFLESASSAHSLIVLLDEIGSVEQALGLPHPSLSLGATDAD